MKEITLYRSDFVDRSDTNLFNDFLEELGYNDTDEPKINDINEITLTLEDYTVF